MDFKESKTKENLMRAFAGESQAQNRYTFAAEAAHEQKLYIIEDVFKFTKNQEKEHARIFFDFLKDFSGSEITVDGTYPVEKYTDIKTLLKNAHINEMHEHDTVYKEFAQIAKDEGFEEISLKFRHIADIERFHGERFEYFLRLYESGMLFEAANEGRWMCLNCGHIHFGKSAPAMCPVCRKEIGYFVRSELAAFGGQYGKYGHYMNHD